MTEQQVIEDAKKSGGSVNQSGVTTYTQTSMVDGTYQYEITDVNNCTYIETVVLSCIPCTLDVSGTVHDLLCVEDKGSYDVIAISQGNGSFTFTYNLIGPVSVGPISGQPGNYTFNESKS